MNNDLDRENTLLHMLSFNHLLKRLISLVFVPPHSACTRASAELVWKHCVVSNPHKAPYSQLETAPFDKGSPLM
jgi:hypothetical protein